MKQIHCQDRHDLDYEDESTKREGTPGEHEQHPGWVHAKSVQEIHWALNALPEGECLVDVDGDFVYECTIDGDNAIVHYKVDRDEVEDRERHYEVGFSDEYSPPGYVLIPVPDVTDEEMQAAIASIQEAVK